jgi:hypothetical protein
LSTFAPSFNGYSTRAVPAVCHHLTGGELALIEHSENVAFDPQPGASTNFHVLTGSLRLSGTFDAVSSIAMLSGGAGRVAII